MNALFCKPTLLRTRAAFKILLSLFDPIFSGEWIILIANHLMCRALSRSP